MLSTPAAIVSGGTLGEEREKIVDDPLPHPCELRVDLPIGLMSKRERNLVGRANPPLHQFRFSHRCLPLLFSSSSFGIISSTSSLNLVRSMFEQVDQLPHLGAGEALAHHHGDNRTCGLFLWILSSIAIAAPARNDRGGMRDVPSSCHTTLSFVRADVTHVTAGIPFDGGAQFAGLEQRGVHHLAGERFRL